MIIRYAAITKDDNRKKAAKAGAEERQFEERVSL